MKTAHIKTFGCQMNEHDSLKMQRLLEGLGYAPVDEAEGADLVIFNTCTIREKAHHKAISELGRAAGIKRANPRAIVGVAGCVAQEEGARLLERFPELDFVFGPDEIWRLPELVEDALAGARRVAVELIDDPARYHFIGHVPPVINHQSPVTSHQSPVTAFVSVMKGCNCACSYCIVPSVRGRELSRPAGEIVEEVARLCDGGVKEVTLLGQNVCAYGRGGETRLAGLIRRIAQETQVFRIRFTSPHPRDVGDDLIAEYAGNGKLCPHIHLPVQSGSSATLKRMRRGYTRERYVETARALRGTRPGFSITTDLIVGFPGETDADFEETLSMMREVGFDSAFAFKYSPRPGTEAERSMADDVPQGVKEQRLAILLDQQRGAGRAANMALVGSEGDALVTGLDRMGKGLLTGRLPDNRIVHFPGNEGLVGSIVRVKIAAAHDNSLTAEAL